MRNDLIPFSPVIDFKWPATCGNCDYQSFGYHSASSSALDATIRKYFNLTPVIGICAFGIENSLDEHPDSTHWQICRTNSKITIYETLRWSTLLLGNSCKVTKFCFFSLIFIFLPVYYLVNSLACCIYAFFPHFQIHWRTSLNRKRAALTKHSFPITFVLQLLLPLIRARDENGEMCACLLSVLARSNSGHSWRWGTLSSEWIRPDCIAYFLVGFYYFISFRFWLLIFLCVFSLIRFIL